MKPIDPASRATVSERGYLSGGLGHVPGGGPKPTSLASTQQSGLTGELLLSRHTRAERFNPTQLLSHEWKPFEIDRPTIIRATGALANAYSRTGTGPYVYAGVPPWKGGGQLFAQPVSLPPGLTDFSAIAGASPTYPDLSHCLRAYGPGVLYLPHPGRWWVLYVGGNSTSLCDVSQIDASDPGLVTRLLNEPGSMAVHQDYQSVASAAAIELLPANPFRTSVFVQSLSPNVVNIYYDGGSSPFYGPFFLTGVGSTLSLTGAHVLKKRIMMQSATVGAAVYVQDFC